MRVRVLVRIRVIFRDFADISFLFADSLHVLYVRRVQVLVVRFRSCVYNGYVVGVFASDCISSGR